jgi:hypothetical protein
MKDPKNKTAPNPEVVFTELGDKEAVLLHLGTKSYYSLNETGVLIWQMLERGLELKEIIAELQKEFDVISEKAKESVLGLMRELSAEKLLMAATDSPDTDHGQDKK